MTTEDYGRQATRPREIAATGWKDIAKRVRRDNQKDNLTLVAGGVAFYAFLAIFPAVAAVVSLYGIFADPADVERQVAAVGGALPQGVHELLTQQTRSVAGGSSSALGWGLALGVVLAIWSAKKGMTALIKGMNIAYDVERERGFIKQNALALTLTIVSIVGVVVAIALIAAVPPLLGNLGLGGPGRVALDVLRWPLLAGLVLIGLAVLYRFGPNVSGRTWRWVTPGSLMATALWLVVSILFSVYVANFGNYNETYGSLGAVVILLLWLFLSAYVILLGAELNAEAERQGRRRGAEAGSPG